MKPHEPVKPRVPPVINPVPQHVAIIMDGNGRWARKKGLPRVLGHRKGAETVRNVVSSALEYRIPYLTLYTFSEENWQRPQEEVSFLMDLLRDHLQKSADDFSKEGVRIKILGERERLPSDIQTSLTMLEEQTAANNSLLLSFAISYSGRQELLRAARQLAQDAREGRIDPAKLSADDLARRLYSCDIPDPDLLIRTGGEKRISNFLLWQLAYSEMVFLDCYWPEFSKEHFQEVLREFASRERRFGQLSEEQHLAQEDEAQRRDGQRRHAE